MLKFEIKTTNHVQLYMYFSPVTKIVLPQKVFIVLYSSVFIVFSVLYSSIELYKIAVF